MPTPVGVVASQHTVLAPTFDMTGVQLWIDAADASTFSYSSGNNVSAWRDKSPSGLSFTYGGAQIPTRVTNSINGMPAVTFTPTIMQTSLLNVTKWVDPTDMRSCMIFSIVAFDTQPGQGVTWIGHGSASTSMLNLTVADPGQWSIFTMGVANVNQGSTYFMAPNVAIVGKGYQFTYTKQGDIDSVRQNGIEVPSDLNSYTAGAVPSQQANCYIGVNYAGGGGFIGRIAEIIIVARYNEAQRDQIESYLFQKYAIPPFPLSIQWHSAFWASDPAWTPPADGADVLSWHNAGTCASDATMNNPAWYPKFAAAYGNLAGKPALRDNGAASILVSTSPLLSQPFSIFIAGWADPAAAGQDAVFGSADSNGSVMNQGNDAANSMRLYAGNHVQPVGSGRVGPFATAITYNTSTSTMRVNGAPYTPSDPGTAGLQGVRVGSGTTSGTSWKGGWGFVGVKDIPLTTGEINALEAWSASFYGIPIPPTNGLLGWWDASLASSFTFDTGNSVSQWRDLSGNGHHANWVNNSWPATRVPSAMNGFSAIDPHPGSLRTDIPNNPKPFTLFAVIKQGPSAANVSLLGNANSTPGSGTLSWDHVNGQYRLLGQGVWLIGQSTATVSYGSRAVIGCSWAADGTWAHYTNGATTGTGNYVNTFGTPGLIEIGASTGPNSANYDGLIGELLLYNRVLTSAESSQVQTYLQRKWMPIPMAGLASWFTADDAASFTYSSGAVVSQWKDKSGNAQDLLQATVAAQPIRDGTRAGMPTVRFNGSHVLAGSTAINVGSVTIFVVCAESSQVANAGIVCLAPPTGDDWTSPNGLAMEVSDSSYYVMLNRNSTQLMNIVGSGAMPWAVWEAVFQPDGSAQAYRDGVLSTTPSNPSAATFGVASGGLVVGGRFLSGAIQSGYRFVGDIGEIIIYNRVLATTERQQVEAYLKRKWGTP